MVPFALLRVRHEEETTKEETEREDEEEEEEVTGEKKIEEGEGKGWGFLFY